MNDLYKEILVKPQPSSANAVKKVLLIVLDVVLLGFGVLFNPFIALGGLLLTGLEIWLVFPRFQLEYEYLYVNGSFDIDAIFAKSSRKRKGSYDISALEVMAPTGSAHLDDYMKRQGLKVLDYSSRQPDKKTWTLIYGDNSQQKALLLELPDEVAQDMRRYAPQKVFFQ